MGMNAALNKTGSQTNRGPGCKEKTISITYKSGVDHKKSPKSNHISDLFINLHIKKTEKCMPNMPFTRYQVVITSD